MWINCALWNKRAESLAQYLTKGKLIAVEETLEPLRSYTTREGDTRTSLEVTVNNVTFCGGEKSQEKTQEPPAQHGQEIPDEDIPF